MYCTKCGKEIRNGAIFCPKCGEKVINQKYIKTDNNVGLDMK